MNWVYVLFNSETEKYYVGYTNNLKRRLIEHHSGTNRSTKFCSKSWHLVYAEVYLHPKDARIREIKLKAHGSGLIELRKRIVNSLEVVSKTGDGER